METFSECKKRLYDTCTADTWPSNNCHPTLPYRSLALKDCALLGQSF